MFCFLKVIEYLLRSDNISNSSQYLLSACDNHVKTILEKKNMVKEVVEKNDNSKEEQIPHTDITLSQVNNILKQVEDLIDTLKLVTKKEIKDVPNEQIQELLRLLGIIPSSFAGTGQGPLYHL